MFYPKQVDLHTLKVGDTVELASGATKEVRSVVYDIFFQDVQVVFTTCKGTLPWRYNRNGTLPGFPMDSIVKIISMNTVDLTTLKEGDTVHLSDCSTAEVVSVASKMLGTVYVIRLRWFGLNRYCVDGCSLDKDKPSIVRIVPKPSVTDTSTAKERGLEILRQNRGRTLRNRVAMSNVEISFGIDPTVTRENLYDSLRKSTLLAGSTPLGISQFVDSLFDVDLTTLRPGDTVELANGKTEKVERITYGGSPEYPFQIYFSSDSPNDKRGWFYSRLGICAGIVSRGIVKTIPFVTPFTTVRGVGATAATVRSKPKLNLYNLEPSAVVTLANGNTKEVLKVDLQSRAHTNHVCITLADGVWIYNPDGTRPPGRDSAYNIVSVTTAAILADIKAHKEFAESVDVTTIKRGDKLTLANGKEVITGKVTARPVAGEIYTVWRENGCPIVDVHVNGTALRAGASTLSIVKITPKPKPTPLTIGGHIVKPGDVLTRAGGDRIVVDKITPEPCGNWKVWHSAHGGCFFELDSSGRCHLSPDLTITAVVPNQTAPQVQPGTRMTLERLTQLVEQRPSAFTEIAQLTGRSVTDLLSDLEKGLSVPWPKPITTPPTKKDADPIGQVAVLDKDGDWMQEEWWAARDMLAEGKITGWAHTQVWHDAKNKLSDPWN